MAGTQNISTRAGSYKVITLLVGTSLSRLHAQEILWYVTAKMHAFAKKEFTLHVFSTPINTRVMLSQISVVSLLSSSVSG